MTEDILEIIKNGGEISARKLDHLHNDLMTAWVLSLFIVGVMLVINVAGGRFANHFVLIGLSSYLMWRLLDWRLLTLVGGLGGVLMAFWDKDISQGVPAAIMTYLKGVVVAIFVVVTLGLPLCRIDYAGHVDQYFGLMFGVGVSAIAALVMAMVKGALKVIPTAFFGIGLIMIGTSLWSTTSEGVRDTLNPFGGSSAPTGKGETIEVKVVRGGKPQHHTMGVDTNIKFLYIPQSSRSFGCATLNPALKQMMGHAGKSFEDVPGQRWTIRLRTEVRVKLLDLIEAGVITGKLPFTTQEETGSCKDVL